MSKKLSRKEFGEQLPELDSKNIDLLFAIYIQDESDEPEYWTECTMCGKEMLHRECGMCTHCETVWNS